MVRTAAAGAAGFGATAGFGAADAAGFGAVCGAALGAVEGVADFGADGGVVPRCGVVAGAVLVGGGVCASRRVGNRTKSIRISEGYHCASGCMS